MNDDEKGKKEESSEDIYIEDTTKSYLRSIAKPLLTKEEEEALGFQILEGNEQAKTMMIERNLRLAASMARHYRGRGLSYLDLVQEGNIGLIKAVNHYDVRKGYRFSTYAIWWIRQEIIRAIAKTGRSMPLPEQLYRNIQKYRKMEQHYLQQRNRRPSLEEVSQELEISLEQVQELKKFLTDTVSLNQTITETEEIELEDVIQDCATGPEDLIQQAIMQENVREFLEKSNLTTRQKEILKLRCGFYGEEAKTLNEIGKIFHITREAVHQQEQKALNKLRQKKEINALKEYLDFPNTSERELKKLNQKKEPTNPIYRQYLQEFLKDSRYQNLLAKLTHQEALIFCLKEGYITENEFSIKEIAKLLNLSEKDTMRIYRLAQVHYQKLKKEKVYKLKKDEI